MEATKKKKAYLKPEMTVNNLKTEGFIAASKIIIDTNPDNENAITIKGILSNKCTSGGVGNTGAAANELKVGNCGTYKVNSVDDTDACELYNMMIQAGIPLINGNTIKICHTDEYLWTAEKL